MELKEAINQLQDDPYIEMFAWLIASGSCTSFNYLTVLRSDLRWRGISVVAAAAAAPAKVIADMFDCEWNDFSLLPWAAQDSTLWQVTTKDGLVRALSRYKEEQCN